MKWEDKHKEHELLQGLISLWDTCDVLATNKSYRTKISKYIHFLMVMKFLEKKCQDIVTYTYYTI